MPARPARPGRSFRLPQATREAKQTPKTELITKINANITDKYICV